MNLLQSPHTSQWAYQAYCCVLRCTGLTCFVEMQWYWNVNLNENQFCVAIVRHHRAALYVSLHLNVPLTDTHNPVTRGLSSVWASFILPTPYVFLQSPLRPPVTTQACRLTGPAAGTAGSRVIMWRSSVIQATCCRVPEESSALKSVAVTSGSQTLPRAQVLAAYIYNIYYRDSVSMQL